MGKHVYCTTLGGKIGENTKEYLTKIFALVLVVLIVTSFFGIFSTLVAGQTTADQDNTLIPIPARPNTQPLDAGQTDAAQDKAMDMIKNVMSVDLSKYNIRLQNSVIMDGVPLANGSRKITSLRYALTLLEGNGDEESVIRVCFTFEKDVLTSLFTLPLSEVVTNTHYTNQNAAVKGFLEKYETYTNIDSSNLIAMIEMSTSQECHN